MKDFKRTVNSKKEVIITVDNKEYLKGAPEGFKESTDYITDQNEANKAIAIDMATKEFKKDKKLQTVKIRIPYGQSKLDNLELGFQRERSFPVVPRNGEPSTGEKRVVPHMSQKAKTKLMGTNTNMKDMKTRFIDTMSKL